MLILHTNLMLWAQYGLLGLNSICGNSYVFTLNVQRIYLNIEINNYDRFYTYSQSTVRSSERDKINKYRYSI